jgi:5-hydroxyisourate hydrolase
LSTHVLDTELGAPAEGLPVSLSRIDDHVLVPVGTAETDARGRIDSLGAVGPGRYRLSFDVQAYYDRHDRRTAFIAQIELDFIVDPSGTHYHVPLLLAPFACTTYRGS